MKIHGQSLGSIFRRLPWQYQVVMAAGSIFILMTIMHVAIVLINWKKKALAPSVQPVKLYLPDNVRGALDPSLAVRPGGQSAWMAYTAQKTEEGGKTTMEVRLAQADAPSGCPRWQDQINGGISGKKERLLAPDGQTPLSQGEWRVETPALVYDPDDKGKQWKIFAFKYFWPDKAQNRLSVIQHYSVIAYEYTDEPGRIWSTEEWLFAAKKDYPPAPYDGMVLLDLDRLSPELQNIVMYSRPSAIYQSGVLAMTLSAFKEGDLEPDRVIEIVSRDHGNSWLYAGTLLDKKDLAAFNMKGQPVYTRIFGATLLQHDGDVYLAAALGTKAQRGAGTLLFRFDNFASGRLETDPKTGAPAIVRRIPLPVPGAGAVGGGTIAYTQACTKAGMMISEQHGASPYFHLFQTGRPLVETKH